MNAIVILADSLRADFLGCYGNNWIRTPQIDKLAKESTIFECAYSEGVPTLPARTAMFTGRYTFPFRGWQGLEPSDILLPEVLRFNSYNTALISDVAPMFTGNYERGFDHVQWIRGQSGFLLPGVDPNIEVDVEKYYKRSARTGRWGDAVAEKFLRNYLRNISQWDWWTSDENHYMAQVIKAGIRWLQSEDRMEPFFLWLDCFDPHEPWDPPNPYNRMYDPEYTGKDLIEALGEVEGYLTEEEERHIRALYAGEVTLVDKWIGVLMDRVRSLGLLEDTLIIFLSDHGEPLGKGGWGHGIMVKTEPWPYEELVRIPFILRHPDGFGKGKRVNTLIETCDVMPSILDFLGVTGPEVMHGQSVLPLVLGEKENIRNYAYCGYYAKSWKIRDDEWSYILWLPEETPMVLRMAKGAATTMTGNVPKKGGVFSTPKKPELYNLKSDPQEQNNVLDKHPEVADSLELKLRRFVSTLY